MLIAVGRFRIFFSFFLVCRGPQAEDQICDSGPQCLSTSINEEARKMGIWALFLSLFMHDVSFKAHLRMAW